MSSCGFSQLDGARPCAKGDSHGEVIGEFRESTGITVAFGPGRCFCGGGRGSIRSSSQLGHPVGKWGQLVEVENRGGTLLYGCEQEVIMEKKIDVHHPLN